MQYFRAVLLQEALVFVNSFPVKTRKKIIDAIERAEFQKDPKYFKKLNNDIWEFRIRNGLSRIRLLAFWDKRNSSDTLVIATHGFIKKNDKVPGNEMTRAINIKAKYFYPEN